MRIHLVHNHLARRAFSLVTSAVMVLSATLSFASDTERGYRPLRTADGKADLQGIWNNSSVTGLERPASVKQLVLSEGEVAQLVASSTFFKFVVNDDRKSVDPKTGLLDGSDLAEGYGYNGFWLEPGSEPGRVRGELRSSWIIDPADGKIPYSVAGRQHAVQMRQRAESFDGPEVRPLGDRCLAAYGRTGPPAVNSGYNNNYQIVQADDHVVILSEFVQHARIVRLNSAHLPKTVRPLFGDSIGWWEGDTLVVETTNFSPLHSLYANPAYLTESGKVTERFTRYSAKQILYEYTVEDPALYTQPWRGESSFNKTDDRIYEAACHEGNYSLTGILAGAREQEKKALNK